MAQKIRICSIRPSTKAETVDVKQVFDGAADNTLATIATAIVAATINGKPHLFIYDTTAESAQVYAVALDGASLAPVGALKIGAGWDLIESFIIGNQPHLMCYRQADGTFAFFPLALPPASPTPYTFRRNHEPGITKGFTTVKPFTASNGLAFLGYSQTDGRVAIYTLSVTPTSTPPLPPLAAQVVWFHQWAKGWTRFAFFQLGGENFFFKTNIAKPNVNIDHIVDGLAGGSVEVSTQMELEDSQQLSHVQPVTLATGDPYFVTYRADGKTTLSRFHGDCQGWTKVADWNAPAQAVNIVPFRAGADTYILFS